MRGFYRPSSKSGELKTCDFEMAKLGPDILTDRENETNYHYSLQMIDRSTYFLNNTEKFLENWVKLGHDTCHKTHGYDAENCHQDCKERETSHFAKQCRKDGGFFKCCIRYIFRMNR